MKLHKLNILMVFLFLLSIFGYAGGGRSQCQCTFVGKMYQPCGGELLFQKSYYDIRFDHGEGLMIFYDIRLYRQDGSYSYDIHGGWCDADGTSYHWRVGFDKNGKAIPPGKYFIKVVFHNGGDPWNCKSGIFTLSKNSISATPPTLGKSNPTIENKGISKPSTIILYPESITRECAGCYRIDLQKAKSSLKKIEPSPGMHRVILSIDTQRPIELFQFNTSQGFHRIVKTRLPSLPKSALGVLKVVNSKGDVHQSWKLKLVFK